jgi:CubicO group peptidase (beta-lactamase class C family)
MGAYATTEAMCNLVAALFAGNRELLNDSNKRRMQHAQSTVSGGYDQGISFGFGSELQVVGARRLAGHGGHMAGHLSATFYDPRAKLAVSVAGNSKTTPSVHIVRGVFGAIDHFGAASQPTTRTNTSNFNVRLRNKISTVQIVQTPASVMAIDPDDWEPFAWGENLEVVDDHTLRVADQHSLYNSGELFEYEYDNGMVQSVRFAGLALQPDDRAT